MGLSKIYATVADKQVAYHRRRRLGVIRALGGKCARCGFDDWRALQIDHINGDGHKERLEHKTNRSYFDYAAIMRGEKADKYQLLCANCNWIKRYENGETRKRVNS